MNQEEWMKEGRNASDDILVVPLELLDEVEEKLKVSEKDCERLRYEKAAVEQQFKE